MTTPPAAPAPGTDELTTLLAPLLAASPLQAGPLLTAFRDLALAVEWVDLSALVLPGTKWVAIIGHRRKEDPLRAVLPLPLHTTALVPTELRAIFAALRQINVGDLEVLPPLAPGMDELRAKAVQLTGAAESTGESGDKSGTPDNEGYDAATATAPMQFDSDTLYTAIMTADSTVVYYKLSRGIKKPADVPDE